MAVSRKIVLPPHEDRQTNLFETGEQAWLWFSHCQVNRQLGARFSQGNTDTPRPCEPDDVYRSVMTLYRSRVIKEDQLRVLGEYGHRLTPPNPFDRHEEKDAPLWADALAKLFETLKQKGLAA